MESWNIRTPAQWDWDTFPAIGGAKITEIPPKQVGQSQVQLQPSDWGVANESVYSSNGGACSVSDLGGGCSSRSSISASFDSSSKLRTRVSEINFETGQVLPRDLVKEKQLTRVEDTETCPDAAASVGSVEPLIGLKLGKRTYFEDVCAGSHTKALQMPVVPARSANGTKRLRMSNPSVQSSCCQVEGCNVDLTSVKDYHRKHRVCESHSKCPKVVVAGKERRFCQQCSRFHDLTEFDQKKRSCRRRLSDHNARRRKPPPETFSLSSARISSSIYADRHQMNLLFNRVPFGHLRSTETSAWEGSSDFKMSQTKEYWTGSSKTRCSGGQVKLATSESPSAISPLCHDVDRLVPLKSTCVEVLNQGLEASMIASSTLDGAPDLQRALSLLSTDSWAVPNPGPSSSFDQLVHANHTTAALPATTVLHSNFENWQALLSHESRVLPFTLDSSSSQYQEFQLLKPPYENAFFD